MTTECVVYLGAGCNDNVLGGVCGDNAAYITGLPCTSRKNEFVTYVLGSHFNSAYLWQSQNFLFLIEVMHIISQRRK